MTARPSAMNRRDFVKTAAAGAAAFGVAPMMFVPRFRAPGLLNPGEGGMVFHPNLDPLRVVGVHDPKMTRETKPISPWKVQDELVVPELVSDHIDRMALALTGEKRIRDAWKAIFIKPEKKAWPGVTVAIKTNNIARQHTRSAVLAKMCRVLTDELGVKGGNIFVYDACHGKDMLRKTPFKDLPEGVNVSSLWGGYNLEVPVAPQWTGGEGKTNCLDHLVKGEVDILVNIALCKGHYAPYGGFTMSMKNHLGTFNPKPAHPRPPVGREQGTEYLLAINKSPVILGKADDRKRIDHPVQQLVLVDALWASEDGPMCDSSVQPNHLFMGAFAPVVDHVLAHSFRKEILGFKINEPLTDRFLVEFGIERKDLPNEGRFQDLLAGEKPGKKADGKPENGPVKKTG